MGINDVLRMLKRKPRDHSLGNVNTLPPTSKLLLIAIQLGSSASDPPTAPPPGEQTALSKERPLTDSKPLPGKQLRPASKSAPSSDLKEKLFSKHHVYGLRVLHSPEKPLFDIIFVHGLTGNSFDTWLDKNANIYWPVDLLAKDIEDARILAFGYDADVTKFIGAVGKNNIRDHASSLSKGLADLRADGASVSSFSVSTRQAPQYQFSPSFIIDVI
jgi:hypothetical protein